MHIFELKRYIFVIALHFLIANALLVDSLNLPVHRVKRIVGGKEAKAPPPDDPVVFTRLYNRDARVEGFRNQRTGIYSFLGIHYAEAPIGKNRYARPVYKRLAGDINATRHGQPCIQPDPYNAQRIIGDENCLLLNVYTPRMPDESTGLPVYVWIHPGGFRFGSAAQYDATPMAQEGVLVVAPQYRLGSLGIMGDGTKEFDGNLAMFDLASALRWVTEYISHFGGDPKQVKAIGHGSGAASAMYLSMSRAARSASDISGVVAMSGTALSQYATDTKPVQSVQEVAEINGCPTSNELEIVKCLREKSAEEIILNDSQVQTERLAGRAMIQGFAGSVGFQPHIEDEDDDRGLPSLLVGEPKEQLRNTKFSPVPLLTGTSKHETVNAFTLNNINQIFGSAEKFLGELPGVLKDLAAFLNIDKLTGEIAKPVLPGLAGSLTPSLNDFLKVHDPLNVGQILSKIRQSTTDVLFNLPAVLSAQSWSNVAPAFMYSFEYSGAKSKGINFLRGLPIVAVQGVNDSSELVGHGDELGYMFDANDIFGNPIEEARLVEEEDIKVRKNLIGMLVKFSRGFEGEGKKDTFGGLFKTVTTKTSPVLRVDTGVKVDSDFRFCELSVWGASLTPVTSTTCEGLNSVLPLLNDKLGSAIGNGFGNFAGILEGNANTTRPSLFGQSSRTATGTNRNPLFGGGLLRPGGLLA